MSNIDKQAIDFSKPLETESGEPVKHICHDVIEYKCARVCVDIATGVVYSSPYVGLKIRNKEASPRAKLREQIESAADAYRQFDNGWISEMKCGELSHEYLLFVKEPKNVLALLGELATKEEQRANWFQMAQKLGEDLDTAEKRNAELESDKSRMMDALLAAVALNSAGISLNDFDKCVLRLHEWGAFPDYCIALYVDFIHGLVSESKLLDFGYINDHGAFSARQAEKRIAELQSSHSKLRDTMATIHNTIRMDGGYTPLAAILNAAKRAYEESAAAGIGKGE
ncbi:hypothetical protein R4R86_004435 [Citrobacter farmeri]